MVLKHNLPAVVRKVLEIINLGNMFMSVSLAVAVMP